MEIKTEFTPLQIKKVKVEYFHVHVNSTQNFSFDYKVNAMPLQLVNGL
jgi:hypothetical protein